MSSVWFVGNGAAYLPPELSKKFMKMVKNAPMMVEGMYPVTLIDHWTHNSQL
jgi:hypothetical protein